MTLFGSSIDASVAVPYSLDVATARPGTPTPPSTTHDGTTSHPRLTMHLPGNHSEVPGEADRPAFGPALSTPSAMPYFDGLPHLMATSQRLSILLDAVVLVGAGAVVYCWRRRRGRDMKIVAPGEDVPMMRRAAADGGGMGELCDTFGEESDDDADEELGLRHPRPTGLGLHTGFMELDGAHAGGAAILYADELEDE